MKKSILLFALIFMIKFMMVFAEDDDDDIKGEIVVDLFVGAAIEVCTHYATCSVILFILSVIVLISALIGCILGTLKPGDVVNARNVRRMGTHYVGRSLVRGW